jgi:transposase
LREIAQIPEGDRVYVDERGIKEDLKRAFGRARRGVTVEDVKRGHDFHRVNVVAAVIHGKEGTRRIAPECYQGSMKAERFEKWFENVLLKRVGEGKTVIMDNAGFHRKKKLTGIGDKAKIKLLFLPPYSPDFNPIEKDWSNTKRDLRDTAPLYGLLETAIYNYWC